MPDLVREVLRNNWWDPTFVGRVENKTEVYTPYFKDGHIMGIKLTMDGSKHRVYAYNAAGRPI